MSDSLEARNEVLPEGWAQSTIGEVYFVNPQKVPADALPSDTPVTFVPMPAVDADCGAITQPVTKEFSAVRKGYTSFLEDDVIVAKITPCMENGKAAIARGLTNRHGFGSSEFHVLRSTGTALPEYIYHFVRQESFRREAESQMTGSVGQKRVPPTFLSQHELPLPPLAEQKRIVAKVEAFLKRVDEARQRLGRVPEILKRFRQSVLAAACSGNLTADWRSDANGNDLPGSWERRSLSSLCSRFEYGSSQKSDSGGKVPVLRMGNIQEGEIDWTDLKFTSDREEIEKYTLQPNTVLFNRTNSPELVGKAAIYRGERPAVFAGYLIRIHHGSELDPEYLNYCLNSSEFREYCSHVKSDGVSQSNINAQKLAAYELPWCPVDEQKEIVRRVKGLLQCTAQIEQKVALGQLRTERITQSVLTRAFAGELVETEADLARREGRDYEPASVLLQRIAAGQSETISSIRLERGRAVLDILLLLEAWNQPVSISALEPALVLMRNDAARQVLLNGGATRRRRRSLSNKPQFVRGLDVIYSGLVANGAIRRIGQAGYELANSQLLSQANAADRAKAAEVIRAIQTLSDLRSLPQAVAAITHEQYEITV